MFAHPAYPRSRTGYGCSCGCGTCSSSYGFLEDFGVSAPKWDWDSYYYDSCPNYKKRVDEYEKARGKYERLPSAGGIRVGSRAYAYAQSMKEAIRRGNRALKACESKELSSSNVPEVLSAEEIRQQIGFTDSGAVADDGSLKPLLYVGAAATVIVGGIVAYKVATKKRGAKPGAGAGGKAT